MFSKKFNVLQKLLGLFICVLVAGFVLVAVSDNNIVNAASSPQNSIVGTWVRSNDSGFSAITFRSDGTFSTPFNGTYLIEKNLITTVMQFEPDVPESTVTNISTFEVNENELTLRLIYSERNGQKGVEQGKIIENGAETPTNTFRRAPTGKDALVGRWKWVIEEGQSTKDIPVDMELLKDGSGIIDKMSIEWKVENGRFYAMLRSQAYAWDYIVVDSNRMILIDDDGRHIYRKQ